jgi:hypothetical protein
MFNPNNSLENEILAQEQMNTKYHQVIPYTLPIGFPYAKVLYISIAQSIFKKLCYF